MNVGHAKCRYVDTHWSLPAVAHDMNYSKMRNFLPSRSYAFQSFILHATCLLISPAFSAAEADAAQQLPQHAPEVRALMEWFEQEANSFNRKQRVRREFPDDPTSAIGVFAAEDISEGEILFSLPWNAMINDQRTAGAKGADAPDEGAIECNTVRNLIDEMKLDDESKYAPYVKYLMNQRAGQLPSAWSKEGKALLFEVLGGVNTLPPKHPYHWISNDWHQGCKGGSDPLEENAAMLVVQRAEDDLMIPLYDMYNHRNGHYHNTINHRVDGKEFYMTASRDIVKGEQIYNSYNLCSGCAGRKGAYGTAGEDSRSFWELFIYYFRTLYTLFFSPRPPRDISRLWLHRAVSPAMDISRDQLCISG